MANIIIWWTGYDANNQQRTLECIAIRSSKSDKNGEFILPTEPSRAHDRRYTEVKRRFFAFQSGYMESPLNYNKNKIERKKYYLKKDERPVKDRVRYLSDLLAQAECQRQKNRKVHLLSYYKSLYKEVTQMQLSSKDHGILRQIHHRLVLSWQDGESPMMRNNIEKYFDDNIKETLLKK